MNKTLNGHFDKPEQAKNTREDLIAVGIPQDKIFIDEHHQLIKVIIPEEETRQIEEIFERHQLGKA
ncbi:MAG: hypothetical protein RQ741_05355 [Wenzhouxiangellaceae bacterium]|nr:hypothetical protein [Wenzhouxiangellaceae bacterium]